MCAVGIGLTMSMNAAPLLLLELSYPTHRGKFTSIYNSSWYLGSIISAWVSRLKRVLGIRGAHKIFIGRLWCIPTRRRKHLVVAGAKFSPSFGASTPDTTRLVHP